MNFMNTTGRKIANRDLFIGWAVWRDGYLEDCYIKDFMSDVGKKIANRDLFIGWAIWRELYVEENEKMAFLQVAAATSLSTSLECDGTGNGRGRTFRMT
jgi:hypothetical protein